MLLLAIFLLSVFLRFFQLGQNPPFLTWDEVAWGYNAYSLGIDGKDEFGRFLPLNYLESFGDFKPPLYAYLDILPIKIFGLNEFAVRFPSAFFGVLTVCITYFLVKRIFKSRESSAEKIALFSSLFMAISPWHINLSRAAFEANVASFFIVSGVWLFLAGVQEKKWCLLFSIVSFILSLYTFNTARIVSPLLVIFLLIGFRKILWQRKNELLLFFIIGLILILPSVSFLLSPQAQLRFKEVNIFSNPAIVERTNQEIINAGNSLFAKVIHNRRVAYGIEYLKHYFDNLNPNFLFIKGDGNPKFSTQDVGQMYAWDIIFFIPGLLFLFKKKEGNWWIIPVWLLIGIIPAATARETPHALRIETTLPTFQIISAYGLVGVMLYLLKIKYKFLNIKITSLGYLLIIILLFLNFVYYFHGYYAHYPRVYSGEWQYGYKDSINFVRDEEKKFDKVYVTDSLGRPYIYYLFYLKVDPEFFRNTAIVKRDVFGFVNIEGFGKYRFVKNLDIVPKTGEKILYINVSSNVPQDAKILDKFKLMNNKDKLTAHTR